METELLMLEHQYSEYDYMFALSLNHAYTRSKSVHRDVINDIAKQLSKQLGGKICKPNQQKIL
jgi:hypothetical protein